MRIYRRIYFFSASAITGSVKHKISSQAFELQNKSSQICRLTFDLQFAGHNGFSVSVYGLAGIHATVEGTGFTDLQRTDALHTDLPELGVVTNDHLVLHPLNLWLQKNNNLLEICDVNCI